jgi:hypothetical protein
MTDLNQPRVGDIYAEDASGEGHIIPNLSTAPYTPTTEEADQFQAGYEMGKFHGLLEGASLSRKAIIFRLKAEIDKLLSEMDDTGNKIILIMTHTLANAIDAIKEELSEGV